RLFSQQAWARHPLLLVWRRDVPVFDHDRSDIDDRFLSDYLLDDAADSGEKRKRRRIHGIQWLCWLRDFRCQYDCNLDMGCIVLCGSQLRLYLWPLWTAALWVLGSLDDPLYLSFRTSLPGGGSQGPYLGGSRPCTPWQLQPNDLGHFQHHGQCD